MRRGGRTRQQRWRIGDLNSVAAYWLDSANSWYSSLDIVSDDETQLLPNRVSLGHAFFPVVAENVSWYSATDILDEDVQELENRYL